MRLLKHLVAAATLLVWGFPIALIVLTAFRPEAEIFRFGGELSPFSLLPQHPTLDGFVAAAGRSDFLRQVANTLLIGMLQSSATLIVCLMAAYTIARAGKGTKRWLMAAIGLVVFVPYQTAVVPLYIIVRDMSLLNSWVGLILPWIASPMAVLMLKSAIEDVPAEIDEAAKVDGAGPIRTLFVIITPNILPGLATAWIINIIGIYDSLLWPLISLNDPSLQVAQVGLASFFTTWERPSFATAFAASLIIVAPLLPLLLVFQRQFGRTFATSGLK